MHTVVRGPEKQFTRHIAIKPLIVRPLERELRVARAYLSACRYERRVAILMLSRALNISSDALPPPEPSPTRLASERLQSSPSATMDGNLNLTKTQTLSVGLETIHSAADMLLKHSPMSACNALTFWSPIN
ncbi:hypothetical protein LJR290_003174 [Variovorax sp. LjRoot290]|uniref:hypothetical protein n=1 Tax=Variovorax sp. LjRoot290 TaxID=3342316 RepID=UPI003ECC46E3